MGILGLIKDVVMLPVDIALDVTMITPVARILKDDIHQEHPFGTFDRLESLGNNLGETYKK